MALLDLSFLIVLTVQIALSCDVELLVNTDLGTIKGLKAEDGDYYMYMGIPYGQVDSCNPFGAALPHPPFDGIFEAYNDATMCPQVNNDYNNTVMGTLDCLRLNVYVPKSANLAKTRKLNPSIPVMVWLYGGAFQYGNAGKFGPSYLVQHDVIVVTLNYRTGPYGFMCLDIPEVPGNQGLKDQYLALQWVKDNIGAFGGDPDLVTAFGQSAGGHSIDLHLMSTKETLFNKAILQTGSAQALTVLYEPDKLAPIRIARYLDFETDDIRKALLFLSNKTTSLVISAARILEIQFKPCVETVFDDIEPFIAVSWINNERVPKVRNMPVLMGFNNLELASKYFPKNIKYFVNYTIVNNHLKQVFNFNDQVLDEMKNLVDHFYFGDEEKSDKVKWDLIRFDSDFTYIHPVHRTMQRYLENGAGNVYFYMFSYVGGRNALVTTSYNKEQSYGQICCASHSDEIGYLFNNQNQPELTAADRTVMQRMTTMWTNFAKYSDPTPLISQLLPVKWEPVTNNTYYFLDINNKLTLGKRPLHSEMAFWDLFYKHCQKYQKEFEVK